MSYCQLSKKQEEVLSEIKAKMEKYFPSKQYMLETAAFPVKNHINQSRHLNSSHSCLNLIAPQNKSRTKEERINSAQQLFTDNEEDESVHNAKSQLTLKPRKNSVELEKANQRLLNELDSLKKRMGMLEKSNSCGSLPLQKAMGTQKQEAKAMLGLKKYTTDEGKPILKKKGRAAAVVKNRAK